jgi:hypothetical protein
MPRQTAGMNWMKTGFTAFAVVLWLVLLFRRHALTRKAVDFYRFKWSDDFQRKYANFGMVAATVFYAFFIWFLWAEVPN